MKWINCVKHKCLLYVFVSAFAISIVGCSTQQEIIQIAPTIQEVAKEKNIKVLKRKVAIGRFSNETQYAKGAFYDKDNDPLGKQASDILGTKLAASGKFLLLERQDLDKIMDELKISGSDYQKIGADYLIIGSITEFGRKNIGDANVFSMQKNQIVQASVSIRLVDINPTAI